MHTLSVCFSTCHWHPATHCHSTSWFPSHMTSCLYRLFWIAYHCARCLLSCIVSWVPHYDCIWCCLVQFSIQCITILYCIFLGIKCLDESCCMMAVSACAHDMILSAEISWTFHYTNECFSHVNHLCQCCAASIITEVSATILCFTIDSYSITIQSAMRLCFFVIFAMCRHAYFVNA